MQHMNALAACWLLAVIASSPLRAAAPPVMQPPDEKTAAAIHQKTDALGRAVADLRREHVPDWKLADVEVFHKAGVWIAAHNEWYKDYAKWTVQALDRGLERAGQLKAGQAPWLTREGTVYRGYRSAVDGSVQPYRVVLPKGYPGNDKLWRLDLILHGRDDTITEVKFLHAGDSTGPAPEQEFVQLDVYGRGNNAYRWAGEADVFEALAAFRAAERAVHGRETIDPNRIVLRGFSMGGAGAWHLGLQHPSFWCSASPGAGFTTTFGRVKNPEGKLPDYVVKCLGIYDALDYAENVFDVPVVAYGGEIDPQREASESIKDKITPLGLKATFLVGPKMGHKYDPESLKTIMRLQGEQAAAGRNPFPDHVRFVTMTPTFGECFWVKVVRQEHQYERSLVDAERKDDRLHVNTENVRTLQLSAPPQWFRGKAIAVEIDHQTLSLGEGVALEKTGGKWAVASDLNLLKSKSAGNCGPIDDAFNSSFLCVRGTAKPWNPAAQHQAEAELDRFSREWNKYLRGELPVKDDSAVTPEDIKTKNLILFGDPGSNTLIEKVLPQLPIRWTKEGVAVPGKTYPAADHLPALIYPSPLQPGRYVVLNSGHTFHEADFKSTNRMLYPHLGDWAVLEIKPGETDAASAEVIAAGLFDEEWRWAGPAVR